MLHRVNSPGAITFKSQYMVERIFYKDSILIAIYYLFFCSIQGHNLNQAAICIIEYCFVIFVNMPITNEMIV